MNPESESSESSVSGVPGVPGPAAKDAVKAAEIVEKTEGVVGKAEGLHDGAVRTAEVLNRLGDAYQKTSGRGFAAGLDRFIGGCRAVFGGLKEVSEKIEKRTGEKICREFSHEPLIEPLRKDRGENPFMTLSKTMGMFTGATVRKATPFELAQYGGGTLTEIAHLDGNGSGLFRQSSFPIVGAFVPASSVNPRMWQFVTQKGTGSFEKWGMVFGTPAGARCYYGREGTYECGTFYLFPRSFLYTRQKLKGPARGVLVTVAQVGLPRTTVTLPGRTTSPVPLRGISNLRF